MPYIKQQDRNRIDRGGCPKTAGELNYGIHILLEQFLSVAGENYQSYNDMIGALEAAKLELYRRRVSQYEDKKELLNGNIPFYQV
jgi:hypothetical protein